MDDLIVGKIKELLAKNNNIGIAVGKNPKTDEMGAALALYLTLSAQGKNVTVASPSEPIVEISNLVGIDKVKKAFNGQRGDLVVSFPYKEGEIEKISYTLEEGKLNILVKAGETGLTFDEKTIEYRRGGRAPKLIFVIGTPKLSDLGKVFDPEALKDSTIVNIDYKKDNQDFGDVLLVDHGLSSASEMVANLIVSLGLEIDQDVASNLLAGIIDATNNFQKEDTGSLAFEMAALLMRKGAKRKLGSSDKEQKAETEAYSFFAPQKTVKKTEQAKTNPPDDWLAPKIYKGSTTV